MRFKQRWLESFWDDPIGFHPREMSPQLSKQLFRKLQMLDAATELRDLKPSLGNRLEPLQGNRSGQYSIRVNAQWRLCFVRQDGEAREVEFCGYHK